jgi:hypothetical protein
MNVLANAFLKVYISIKNCVINYQCMTSQTCDVKTDKKNCKVFLTPKSRISNSYNTNIFY